MKKGLLFVLLITLIHYNVVNGNHNNVVIGNEFESEFSFGSHVARMLYDVSLSVCGKTGNQFNHAVLCPERFSYRSCLPDPNGGGPRQRCGDYSRVSSVNTKNENSCILIPTATVHWCNILDAIMWLVKHNIKWKNFNQNGFYVKVGYLGSTIRVTCQLK
ncbi:hypothetical protein VNO78_38026 [Psophocarpus tetragonolobus]|uniref:Uncharacterized protein n=1 Tax=Psophocarpus tetragonolobus TaxID=3891 RepID=A0AAN9NGJ0_PSOTE